jgi:8-oxo-dGTP pyrophosphatase MutT (NUDIX family)
MMSYNAELAIFPQRFPITSTRDEQNWSAIRTLFTISANPFDRSEDHGHITTSAVVVDQQLSHILMIHHAKLDMWLPPGGHCDSDSDLLRVCRREVFEETGQQHLVPLTNDIFDIDIHVIPESKKNRRHLHYDVRFAFTADMTQPLVVSAESNDLRWVSLKDLKKYNSLASVLILKEKLENLKP